MPSYVEVILEYEFFKITRNENFEDRGMKELVILKKALPIIQKQEIEKFMELNNHFCTMEMKINNYNRIKKYLPNI